MLSSLNVWILKVLARMELLKHESRQVIANQRGAGTVEYALVIAVIVIMIVGATSVMDTPLRDFFRDVVQTVRDQF